MSLPLIVRIPVLLLRVVMIAVCNGVSFISFLSLDIQTMAINLRSPDSSSFQCHEWFHPPDEVPSVTVRMFLEEFLR